MTVMATLERIRPSTIVMPSPMTGRKEKKPIHAPRPAMKRLALSSSFLFTCRYYSIQSMRPSMPMP